MHARITFTILGPLDADLVDRAGVSRPLALGPFKQRVLLAMLLCRANTFVSVDRLTEALWDDPPRTAHKNVQVYVSHLRRVLSADGIVDRILHRTRAYSMRVPPEDLDSARFEAIVGEGRSAYRAGRVVEAATTLRRALDMWRGDPLADLAVVPALRDEVTRLADRRLTVLEDWIDAELQLGRHADVLDQIEKSVRAHPLRERLRGQQLLALYRSGRQSEGLAEYDNLRRRLAAELGLEPSPVLQRLYQAMLSGDPSLNHQATGTATATVSAAPRSGVELAQAAMLPRDLEDFVEQRAAVDDLSRVLTETGRGRGGRLVVLSGAPGAGKTALAVHVAHRLHQHFPDGRLLVPLRDRAGAPLPVPAVLGTVLDHLGIDADQQPASEPRRLALFRALVADRRMLLVYDDPSGEEQVRRLLPGAGPTSVLVTSRRYLGGLSAAHHQWLAPMPAERATVLLHSAAQQRPGLDESVASRIVDCCGGLPLAIRIAGILLHSRRHVSPRRLAERLDSRFLLDELVAGDLSMRGVLDRFWDDLDHSERVALGLAAGLASTSFDLASFAAAAGVRPAAAERALEALVECQAVWPIGYDDGGEASFWIPGPIRCYALDRSDRLALGSR